MRDLTGVSHSERIDTIYNVTLFQSISYHLKMSRPLSAPNSIVYEAPALQQDEEAPSQGHSRQSSPVRRDPESTRLPQN